MRNEQEEARRQAEEFTLEIIYSTAEYRTVIEIPDGRDAEVLSYCDTHFGEITQAEKDRRARVMDAILAGRKV